MRRALDAHRRARHGARAAAHDPHRGSLEHDDRLSRRTMARSRMRRNAETMDRNLALEAVRVTEAAALSASRLMGRGDEKAADQAAVDAMRQALNSLAIDGTVVIGEGERDEAPMLYIGEKVGTGHGPQDRHRARSARGHDDHRQGRRQRARGDRDGRARRLPQRARRLHGQDRGRRRPAGRGRRSRRDAARPTCKNLARGQEGARSPISWSASSTGRAMPS